MVKVGRMLEEQYLASMELLLQPGSWPAGDFVFQSSERLCEAVVCHTYSRSGEAHVSGNVCEESVEIYRPRATLVFAVGELPTATCGC